jgi:hypothetical protein
MLGFPRYGVRAAARLLHSQPHPRYSYLRISKCEFRQFTNPAVSRRKQDQQAQDGAAVEKIEKAEKQKAARIAARNTSLRRVGLEAERSRVIVRHKGGLRVIDPEVVTKVGSNMQKSKLY